ncbi:MAG: Gfo/Idh/MocA family oxidoreductase [Planctomycetota bacterium]|nr:Gfo/Idh/MocA family oxidoreductase [Planctomycetota bacterium]MDA1179782.1 Gfo/Idh/MocA family oxidoreductase [Planctomycetota bacterium]
MSKLRVAVVGGGHLGKIHAKLLLTMPSVDFLGVIEPHPAVRAEISQLLGVTCYPTLQTLTSPMDAAVIAAPTQFHADLATQLLSQDIHVFVEKPLASTSVQARAITRLAAQRQLVLQVGHVEAFNPAVAQLPADLWPATWIHAIRQGPYTFRSTDISVVMDLMIHDIDLVLHWQQSPIHHVEASGYSALSDQEDAVQARLYFADGSVAQFIASRVSHHRQRTMEIFAPTGSARVDFSDGRLSVTRPSNNSVTSPADATDRQKNASQLFSELLPTEEFHASQSNPIMNELEDFVRSIQLHRQPRVDGRRATAAIEVAERITDAISGLDWKQKSFSDRRAA